MCINILVINNTEFHEIIYMQDNYYYECCIVVSIYQHKHIIYIVVDKSFDKFQDDDYNDVYNLPAEGWAARHVEVKCNDLLQFLFWCPDEGLPVQCVHP